MTEERIVTPVLIQEEREEPSLRPSLLNEYIGQEKVKENLRIFITAAKQRKEALDHVLLYGRQDWGKLL